MEWLLDTVSMKTSLFNVVGQFIDPDIISRQLLRISHHWTPTPPSKWFSQRRSGKDPGIHHGLRGLNLVSTRWNTVVSKSHPRERDGIRQSKGNMVSSLFHIINKRQNIKKKPDGNHKKQREIASRFEPTFSANPQRRGLNVESEINVALALPATYDHQVTALNSARK